MSLREFHLFFIGVAFVCCASLGGWSVWMLKQGDTDIFGYLGAGAGISSAVATLIYGIYYAKNRHKITI